MRPVRQHLQYLKYKLGVTRSAHLFRSDEAPTRISIVIPDSLGDIVINSSVTRYYRTIYPDVHITLITHPKYVAAGELNVDYDAVHGYSGKFGHIPSGALSYADQLAIAHELTADMDILFLSQPSAWCDALSARHTMLDLQNLLCLVPGEARRLPIVDLPAYALEAAAARRARDGGSAVFMVRHAFTMQFGDLTDDYCRAVANWCVERGVWVYWNGAEPIVPHELCVAVESMPLTEAAALGTLCDATISMRCGFSDIVGFAARDQPHRVFYPEGNYPHSRLSWLDWCSLSDMGVRGAEEFVRSFSTEMQVLAEISETVAWLRRVPAFAGV